MKKSQKHLKIVFSALSILLFAILVLFPFRNIKASDNFKSTTTTTEFQNKKFYNFHKPFFIPHRYNHLNCYTNKTKTENIVLKIIKNLINGIIDFIKFVSKNAFGIIFLIWLFISIKRAIHNHNIKREYKSDNNKYEAKRNEDEGDKGDRHSIYLVSKEKNGEGKLVYHHIINLYSLAKLGYIRPSRKNDCFSAKSEEYIMGENIVFYNVYFDFKNIDNYK